MKTMWCALAALLLACGMAQAADDVVLLKNGDKITGSLAKVEGGTLTIKTNYSKEVKVDWAEVAGLETQAPMRVVMTSGDAVVGRFVERPGGLYLEADGSTRQIDPKEVETIGIAEVVWSGFVGAAVLGTTGNTNSSAFGAKAAVERTTRQNKLSLSARGDYQEQEDNDTGDKRTTVQNALGRLRYDHTLTDEWFISGFDEVDHDYFKDIRVRNRVGVGPGYRFIHTPQMLLSSVVGIAYTYIKYRNQDDDSFPTAFLSEEFRWKLSDDQVLYQLLDIYPNLQEGSDWTLRAEVGYRQTIWLGIFADMGVVFDYDHQPAADAQTNDLRYTLTFGYQW